ncbi:hypothetical protein UA08_04106 [Talaromyces atroroseus]|uniref:Transcription factor domain-containing protein n=1 Tax=Talaromyces atroroseus TaxID=1441469 RepID=A0A1Q5Q939_TALAT|nr:hypothetical protein UA08_04106 [Talaromyces atroroseus]OKL60582.1 hypothetical protein UA08_04106 [Talaromyces atroroseus]
MSSKCATACVMAAIDLTHLVNKTYRTNTADAWWYNGFYVSTAAVVLLISFSDSSMLDPGVMEQARSAWREAMTVLEYLATFRRSASNTLQFLQPAYRQVMVPIDLYQAGVGADANPNFPNNSPGPDTTQIPFFNWDDYLANRGPEFDDLGFLSRLDFPDSLGVDGHDIG